MTLLRKQGRWILVGLLYVLLIAGGLWHMLGVLQDTMRLLAAPMIIAICLMLCVECIRGYGKGEGSEASDGYAAKRSKRFTQKFLLWSGFVIVASFLLELIGVQTAAIFGKYVYLDTLRPVLWNVPIAIGFAWLGTVISSLAIVQRIIREPAAGPARIALLVAVFMVIFDFFMEPAAIKLSYWQWDGGSPPLRNYLDWFIFGFIFSYIGLRLGLFRKNMSALPLHAYVAQILYFLMVTLGT